MTPQFFAEHDFKHGTDQHSWSIGFFLVDGKITWRGKGQYAPHGYFMGTGAVLFEGGGVTSTRHIDLDEAERSPLKLVGFIVQYPDEFLGSDFDIGEGSLAINGLGKAFAAQFRRAD